jgi:hypothetical protein
VTDLEALVAACAQDRLPALVAQLAAAQAAAAARLLAPPPKPPAAPEVNISVAEAARRLGVSKDWIYKNATSLPFVARIGTRVVCSAPHVERFRTSRLGRGDGTR